MRSLRGVDKWPIAEAEILSCNWVVTPGPEGDSGEFKIEFRFNLAGTYYYGSFSLPGYGNARLFTSGDTIEIQYNPHNPNQSLYSEAWSGGEILMLGSMFVIVLFFGHWLVTGSPWFSSNK